MKKENSPHLERFDGSLEDIARQFPQASEWLQQHNSAQIYRAARLPSAEEKLLRFGGADAVRQAFDRRRPGEASIALVLQACRDGAMHPLEIIRLSGLIGRTLSLRSLSYVLEILELNEEDRLRRVEGMTYIRKLKTQSFRVYLDTFGYETTETGLRSLVADFQPSDSPSYLGRLFPKPTQG